jgi:AraC family transcriptional regulator, positive regulator of tynA and feaB
METDDNASRLGSGAASIVSTEHVPARQRFEYWREVCTRSFVDLRPERSARTTFRGEISGRRFGAINVSQVSSVDQRVIRDSSSIARCGKDVLFVNVALVGIGTFRQGAEDVLMREGDFALVDAARPFELGFTDAFVQTSFTIERSLLMPHLLDQSAGGLVVRASTPLGGLVSSFLRHASSLSSLSATEATVVSRHVLGLLAIAFGAGADARAAARADLREAVRRRAMDVIELHFGDPELSPARIAGAVRVSVRYLHACFEPAGTSVMEYLLRRRLEHCRDELARADRVHRSISEIAFAAGFSELSHFGRAFKRTFAMTPREWRARFAQS